LLGGSPLRLFRISERARQVVARWRAGGAVGSRRGTQLLARRLASAGAFVPRATDGTLGRGDVTVVVPVRDRPAQLDRVLDALRGLPCVVVDDASADAGSTKEVAERHGARFVGLATNIGPAGARNVGLAAVHSALVAFVDSDCVPTDGWLGPLLGQFADPLVAAVAPRIVRVGKPARYESARSSLDRGDRAGPVRPGSRIPFVPSAALLVRADLALGPDLFDAALRGGEDVDLVWRLGEAGWDVRYVPSSTVAHEGPPALRAFLARRAFYGTTAAPLARRHGEALAPVHLSGWSLAVWGLVLARRPVLALAALAASIVILAHRLSGLVRDPVVVAARIAGGGTVRAALPALASLTRAWSPGLVIGLAFRRTRAVSALALLIPAFSHWLTDRQGLDPVRAVAVHIADDVAYGSGVWVGCARERTLVPLIPRVSWRSRVWASPALRNELQPPSPSAEED
jgi:mycofactocin system glycosyltransferase